MTVQKFEKLLQANARLISTLQNELEETNKGVIQLIMELEEIQKDDQLYECEHTIRQLQKELEETNKGLLALAVELDQSEDRLGLGADSRGIGQFGHLRGEPVELLL